MVYDRARSSSAKRGYGHHWRKRRRQWLNDHPLCEWHCDDGRICNMPGTDVDHIIPKRRGGADDESNFQTLCHEHHSLKTAREDGGFGNGAVQSQKA